MQYFIGIVPDDPFYHQLENLRTKWRKNRISEVVEPHITLKAQGGLTPEREWLEEIRRVCSETKPFTIELGRPRFFGEDILYLSAFSPCIYPLHQKLVEAAAPSASMIKKYFELDQFVPHLTMGKATFGLSNQELREMADQAEKVFIPYPKWEVTYVRVYQEIEPMKYVKFEDISLNNHSAKS